jgi:hypothetical protein
LLHIVVSHCPTNNHIGYYLSFSEKDNLMDNLNTPSPLRHDTDAALPAAAYLRYETRADGWSAGRQAACLVHLADNGIVADAVRSVGMSVGGSYALRRQARGYAFNLGWEAALIIARRIVADNLMTASIKGEVAQWVREDGVTTYTRQNTKLSLALLDRVNPATALPEVIAVATRFDCFLQMIDESLSAEELWELFFDEALPHSDIEARARVRAALLLSEESEGFDEEEDAADDEEAEAPIEYKSMDGPQSSVGKQCEALPVPSARAANLCVSARNKKVHAEPVEARFAAMIFCTLPLANTRSSCNFMSMGKIGTGCRLPLSSVVCRKRVAAAEASPQSKPMIFPLLRPIKLILETSP